MVVHKNIKQNRWIGLHGGFLKWWYPHIIHFNRVFHYFHHPFWDTTILGNPQIGTLQLFYFKQVSSSQGNPQVGCLETFEFWNAEQGRPKKQRKQKQPHNGNQPNRILGQFLKDNSKQQGQQQDSRHHHLHPDNDVRPPKLRQQKLPKRRLSLRRGYTSRWLRICRKTLEEKNTYCLKKKVASRCQEDNRNQLVLNTLPAKSLAMEKNGHWGKDVTISVVWWI